MPTWSTRVLAPLLAILAFTSTLLAAPERWKGVIQIPNLPQGLVFELALTRGDKPTATMSIPQQGFKDGPVEDVVLDGNALRFLLKPPGAPEMAWARFEFTLAADGQSGTGTLNQAGQRFPATLTRLAEGDSIAPQRPQTPKPPFPYTQRELTVTAADGAIMPGTLTIPDAAKFGPGPHPAVLLITGSGTQDRDETLFDHKPFAVIADAFTRAGLAVLRVDDRGWAGHHNPTGPNATTLTHVDDAIACINALAKEPGIDPKRLGLVGHSEGGLIAPFAANRSDLVAFIVLLAGTGVPGKDVMRVQLESLARANGVNEESVAAQAKYRENILNLVATGADRDAIRAALRALGRQQMGLAEGAPETPEQAKQLDAIGESESAAFSSPWMRTFMTLDPREALRKLKQPVLAINGSLDRQVVASQNLPEIEKALKESGNPDVTIKEIPGLNHLFQPATTGAGSEYPVIETTFDPDTLVLVTNWLRERAGVKP
jgi:uncharacterized protein